MSYEIFFLEALAVTVAAECAVSVILKKYADKYLRFRCGYGRLILVTALASILTLPYVWFVLPAFMKGSMYMVTAELFAFALEAVWYRVALQIGIRQALALSFLANLFSFLTGLILL